MADERDPLGILGKTLEDKYRVESLAGMGGFSAVYRAQHLVWNEPVAIKFFTMLEDAEDEIRERLLQDFVQEGKLMTKLSSRSAAIVQARDMGKLEVSESGDWIPYMVLEWLEGTPLDQVISQERKAAMPTRSLAEVMTLLEPAAIALDVAHKNSVAHRDLKPANFVISGDPRDPEAGLKVLDFGIAKVMEGQVELQEQLQLTGQHITAFTPNYGAPEQFSRNFGATGPWTDVYAMALIVLELCRGTRVLDGETFFELGVMTSDQAKRPTPQALGLEVSDEVEAVFARALAVNPEERYSTMGDFWRELHACVFEGADTWSPRTNRPSLRDSDSHQVVITPTDPQSVGGPSPDTVSALTMTGRRRRKRSAIIWAAGAVAVASIAVLVVAITTRSGPAASASAPLPVSTASEDKAPAMETSTPAPSSSPSPAASASPSSDPSAPPAASTTEPIVPPPVSKRPATPEQPAPAASEKASGGDPWDPSSFGGRR